MLIIRLLLLAALFCAYLSVHAAGFGEDCDAKLVTDLYYGAMVVALEKGVLKTEDLALAATSETPINPLANLTPGSRNSAAMHTFETLSVNETVRSIWPLTRKRLQNLLAKHSREAGTVHKAREQTRRIISPHVIREITQTKNDLHLTTLADGTAVVVHFPKGKELIVTRIADGKEMYWAPFENFGHLHFGKLTDKNGMSQLFIMGTESDHAIPAKFFVLNLNKLELKKFDVKLEKGFATRFIELSPNVLWLETRVDGQWLYRGVTSAGLKDSSRTAGHQMNFTAEGQIKTGLVLGESNDRYFRISENRSVHTHLDEFAMKFSVSIVGRQPISLNLQRPTQGRYIGREVELVELHDGRLILALSQKATVNEECVLSLYDLDAGPDPYYTKTYPGRSLYELHWFFDDQGDAHLSAALLMTKGPFHLVNIDPISLYASEPQALENGPSDWLDAGKEKYFFVHRDTTVKIYSVFGEPE